jgi:hypothetical protein
MRVGDQSRKIVKGLTGRSHGLKNPNTPLGEPESS